MSASVLSYWAMTHCRGPLFLFLPFLGLLASLRHVSPAPLLPPADRQSSPRIARAPAPRRPSPAPR